MHLSTDPTDSQNQNVYALWDQLAEFSVGDGDAALTHLLAALCTMLSARNVLWGVVVRLPSRRRADPLLGWRPRLVRLLPDTGGGSICAEAVRYALVRQRRPVSDPFHVGR